MRDLNKPILCDGCAQPASPQHIAARLARLELATRFRPIHISVLFVAAAPSGPVEDDFYSPRASASLSEAFLNAAEIPQPAGNLPAADANVGRLAEFQRRGYYLAYISECPPPAESENANSWGKDLAERLGSTLVARISRNYKPKYIAPIGEEARQWIPVLQGSGLGGLLLLDCGKPFEWPAPGDAEALRRFRALLATSADRASAAPSV